MAGSIPPGSSKGGDITTVTAGVGLSGGGTSGDTTLTLDLSELSAVVPTSGDWFGTLDSDEANEQLTTTDALATLLAGDGLAATSAVLAVNVDDSTIETSSDALRIKDNGVSLAKMAGLTRGSIIYGDTSGDPAALAKGSADYVLTSDGTDIAWAAASAGAVTALNNATANEIVTVGSTTTELDAESTLTFASSKLIPTATAHNAAGTALTMSAGATTAGTTNNIAGGALTFQGGQGKGSGAGGDIIFQTANAAGSGSSLNSLATALTLSDDLSATFAGAVDLGSNTLTTTGSLQVRTIDYSDGDNAITIADGGGTTFAAAVDLGSNTLTSTGSMQIRTIDYSDGDLAITIADSGLTTIAKTMTFATDANVVLGDGGNVSISTPLLANADHTTTGTTAEMLAGGAISAFNVVCVNTTTQEVVVADASAYATARSIGIAPAAISDTATGTILLQGFIRDDTWGWTTGSTLYLSETAGAMTHTAPTTNGAFVQVVGVALEPDVVYFNPSMDIIEHA
jgi:hypothetical protein